MLHDVANIVNEITPFLPLIGAGATLSGAGFAPRVGPLRAVVLAFSSKFRSSADPFTNRTEELEKIRRLMKVYI